LIEREVDGRWIAEFVDFPGIMAYGDTIEEAIQNALESLKACE
jgi:predicted RNase H-like HicB family nuclease